jgi:hypothetical protein
LQRGEPVRAAAPRPPGAASTLQPRRSLVDAVTSPAMGEAALLRPEETNGYGAAGDPSVLRRRSTVASLAHDDGPDCLAGTRLGSFRNAVAKGVTAYSSPLNVLLVFVPLGFAAALFRLGASIIFLANFIGMIPLASAYRFPGPARPPDSCAATAVLRRLLLLLFHPQKVILGRATEDIGDRTNQTLGALLNVSLGNAVEIILSVSALRAGQLVLIQCTLIGSILSNLLLVLGSAFFVCRLPPPASARHAGDGGRARLTSPLSPRPRVGRDRSAGSRSRSSRFCRR